MVEGTANYVETRAVVAFAQLCNRPGSAPRLQRLCPLFADMDVARWLGDDFDRRIIGGAIAPTDMARNRIYPAAAAVAFLLDLYQPGWKPMVEREGTTRGLFLHLSEAIGTDPANRSALVERARERYGWQDLLAASRVLVSQYLSRFDSALATFEATAGIRIIVRVPSVGLSRSRSSRAERFVADAGRRTLGQFSVYSLRRAAPPALELNIKDAEVLDEIDDDGYRVVTFHVAGPVLVTADGRAVSTDAEVHRDFRMLSLESSSAKFRTEVGGTLTTRAGEIRIDIGLGTGR